MSQMLRSALMLARRPWAKPATALDVFHTRFRVLPWDCDLNLHLTNTRYPAWLDLARTEFFCARAPPTVRARAGVGTGQPDFNLVREIKSAGVGGWKAGCCTGP